MLITPGGPDFAAIRKSITFDGGAGTGATGAVPIFTTTGQVFIERIVGIVTTSLTVGAGATLALGVTGVTSLFIAATAGSALLTTARIWVSTTPTAGGILIPTIPQDTAIETNIIGTVAVNSITAGVILFVVEWRPLSSGASLA